MSNTFQLYALRSNLENITKYQDERFVRITATYMLLYTDKEQPENSVVIDGDNLSTADAQWLYDCGGIILMNLIEIHKDDIKNDIQEKIKNLEAELQKQKEIVENGTDDRA